MVLSLTRRHHRSAAITVLGLLVLVGIFHGSSSHLRNTFSFQLLEYDLQLQPLGVDSNSPNDNIQPTAQLVLKPGSSAPVADSDEITSDEYPKNIFQTWKYLDDLPVDGQRSIDSWRKWNPLYNHTLYDDDAALDWVTFHFSHRPDIVKVFTELQQRIIAFDLFRYMLVYIHGGIYSDIDTFCLRPVDSWFADVKDNAGSAVDVSKSSLVIGMEAALVGQNVTKQQNWYRLTNRVQMLQWTIMAKAGHPVLNRTIDAIVSRVFFDLSNSTAPNAMMSNLKYDSGEILNLSGPGLYSKVARAYIDERIGRSVSDDEVAETKAPRLFADVLVLPVNAWAPGQEHSNSGGLETALVQHLWKGNWKSADIYR